MNKSSKESADWKENETTTLEKLAEFARDIVSKSTNKVMMNFKVSGKIASSSVLQPEMLDAFSRAQDWQAIIPPANLRFSHGQYIGPKGLEHIISELKVKRDSNRALYSLISQEHILGSGDTPIPSFMVLQCAIQAEVLFVTAYFRALEVNHFLRINLEEMRMVAEKVCMCFLDVRFVEFTVVAFRAHYVDNSVSLERFVFDTKSEHEIRQYFKQGDMNTLAEIVRAKSRKHTTDIVSTGVEHLHKVISEGRVNVDLKRKGRWEALNSKILRVKDLSAQLKTARASSSHGILLQELYQRLATSYEDLARELEA